MKTHSFDTWYDIYEEEIDRIIQQYKDFIMNSFVSENKYHSLDIQKFTKKMQKLIYETSINKRKDSIIYL